MQCPNCSSAVFPEDNFCEECGFSLKGKVKTTSIGECQRCSAPPEAIDTDGFCGYCGFRNIPSEEERIEITVNSFLAGVSDRGLKHHRNEDYLALQTINDGKTHILVVCDGVSSSQSPELAAKTAAKTTCLALTTAIESGENPESAIKTAFQCAQNSLRDISSAKTDPPSTTMVAAVASENTVTIGWLGDSRAYWLCEKGSKLLTTDHSWLNEVVATGEMNVEEAQLSPHAHAIMRWLGADAEENNQPDVVNFTVSGSGHLLLCSDGLWNYAPDASQIFQLVPQDMDAGGVCRSCVDFARGCGGRDNITVAVLKMGDER